MLTTGCLMCDSAKAQVILGGDIAYRCTMGLFSFKLFKTPKVKFFFYSLECMDWLKSTHVCSYHCVLNVTPLIWVIQSLVYSILLSISLFGVHL